MGGLTVWVNHCLFHHFRGVCSGYSGTPCSLSNILLSISYIAPKSMYALEKIHTESNDIPYLLLATCKYEKHCYQESAFPDTKPLL